MPRVSSGGGLEVDRIAEGFQTTDEAALDVLLVAFLDLARTQTQVAGGNQQSGGTGSGPDARDRRCRLGIFLPGSARGDFDNYAKLVSDALNGAVWFDDRQVAEALIRVHLFSWEPRTEVSV
jgi:Endodeoxyribonuclease RusA